MTEEKKTAAFYNRLKARNTAEEWFNALPAIGTASWAAVKTVFQACWPKKTTSSKSANDKSNLLKGHILKEEELGKWEDNNGQDELSHVIWANKILTLANNIPDPAGLLIPEVCHLLPDVIKEQIESEFATWDRFADVIKAISKSSIDNALAKEKKYHLVMEESQAATAAAHATVLQQSPTAPLHHMLRNTAISQYPQAPLPQPQFHQPPPSPSPQQPVPTSRGQMPAQAPFAFCSNKLRAADACANALPQHPNTPAGLVLYAAQVITWNKAFPGRLRTNEFCPYPLTPGTTAICRNECFGCGQVRHCAPECPAPRSLPQHEHGWRAVAAIIFGIIRSHKPAPVRYVDYASTPQYAPRQPWYPQESCYTQPEQPYHEYQTQGKGEGPSTQ